MKLKIAIMMAGIMVTITPALAETDEAFILNSFPHCRGTPVFSPYAAGAVGAVEAEQRARWYKKLKPISGAPCVLPADNGITFCDKLTCRNIEVQ